MDEYMSRNGRGKGIDEMRSYFTTVIDWVKSTFTVLDQPPYKEMCGLEWGRLHREYGGKGRDSSKVIERVRALIADEGVSDKRGDI